MISPISSTMDGLLHGISLRNVGKTIAQSNDLLLHKFSNVKFQLQTYMNCTVMKRLKHRPVTRSANSNSRRRRTQRIILAVTTIFVLAWLPLNVFTLISEFQPRFFKDLMGKYHDVTYGILRLFGGANAVANPLLYGYLNDNFKNEYLHIYQMMPWYKPGLAVSRSLRRSLRNHNRYIFSTYMIISRKM